MVEQTNHQRRLHLLGYPSPTSRSQTFFSIRALKKDYAVIPTVTNSFNQKFWIKTRKFFQKRKLCLFLSRPNQNRLSKLILIH